MYWSTSQSRIHWWPDLSVCIHQLRFHSFNNVRSCCSTIHHIVLLFRKSSSGSDQWGQRQQCQCWVRRQSWLGAIVKFTTLPHKCLSNGYLDSWCTYAYKNEIHSQVCPRRKRQQRRHAERQPLLAAPGLRQQFGHEEGGILLNCFVFLWNSCSVNNTESHTLLQTKTA